MSAIREAALDQKLSLASKGVVKIDFLDVESKKTYELREFFDTSELGFQVDPISFQSNQTLCMA